MANNRSDDTDALEAAIREALARRNYDAFRQEMFGEPLPFVSLSESEGFRRDVYFRGMQDFTPVVLDPRRVVMGADSVGSDGAMTESDWLTSTDPQRLLGFVTGYGQGNVWVETGRPKASDRQLRLWVEACRACMRPGAAWANRLDTEAELQRALYDLCHRASSAYQAECPMSIRAAILRDIFGNPFRPVTLCTTDCPDPTEGYHGPGCPITPTVLSLAQAAYAERDERTGQLDPLRLAVLADALEEAGCTEQALLRHLRGEELIPQPATGNPPLAWCGPKRGPCVRGCWAVDLLTGRS